ncbi:hypothetical protein XELAEV_18020114mg [Xenopus laevis]|uniref:Uncharacterized protein n=1 Tax=Xenopus laevis TaxID=8355 RepID=A0A974D941_XENLA|nr:hypothetical protein XELAEV_18020114mg [Xenopus laevis]
MSRDTPHVDFRTNPRIAPINIWLLQIYRFPRNHSLGNGRFQSRILKKSATGPTMYLIYPKAIDNRSDEEMLHFMGIIMGCAAID